MAMGRPAGTAVFKRTLEIRLEPMLLEEARFHAKNRRWTVQRYVREALRLHNRQDSGMSEEALKAVRGKPEEPITEEMKESGREVSSATQANAVKGEAEVIGGAVVTPASEGEVERKVIEVMTKGVEVPASESSQGGNGGFDLPPDWMISPQDEDGNLMPAVMPVNEAAVPASPEPAKQQQETAQQKASNPYETFYQRR